MIFSVKVRVSPSVKKMTENVLAFALTFTLSFVGQIVEMVNLTNEISNTIT